MQTKHLISSSDRIRREVVKLLDKYKINRQSYYLSSHFFERVVERNLDLRIDDILISVCKGIKYAKDTAFNQRILKYTIKGLCIIMEIAQEPVTKQKSWS